MRKSLAAVVKFLNAHRAKIAAGITATVFLTLMARNARELEKFMKEHDLLDEYNAWLIGADE